MLSYYSSLSAEVYDLDKPIGKSFGDVEFYRERLASNDGRILEPASGTGRLLVPLLEDGLHVDGFDSSAEMLDICRAHCKERGLHPKLFEADMQTFRIDVQYDAIILPAGTFQLLAGREQAIKALKNFRKHLAPGGRLLIDLYIPQGFEIDRPKTRTWQTKKGEVITLESKTVEVDWIKQYSVSHNRYEKWQGGKLIQTELERFPMRWYGVEEFKLLLGSQNFEDIIVSSNYEYGLYPKNAEHAVTFEAIAHN